MRLPLWADWPWHAGATGSEIHCGSKRHSGPRRRGSAGASVAAGEGDVAHRDCVWCHSHAMRGIAGYEGAFGSSPIGDPRWRLRARVTATPPLRGDINRACRASECIETGWWISIPTHARPGAVSAAPTGIGRVHCHTDPGSRGGPPANPRATVRTLSEISLRSLENIMRLRLASSRVVGLAIVSCERPDPPRARTLCGKRSRVAQAPLTRRGRAIVRIM